MPDVLAVVEGQSERAFLETVLAPHLSLRGIHITARLVGEPGHKGGSRRPWESVRKETTQLLRGGRRRARYVTTMFDYYGMPDSWPGRANASRQPHERKAHTVETAIHADICESLGVAFDQRLFVPYVQMHELEALIFVRPATLEYEFVEMSAKVAALAASVHGMRPEEINDSPLTAPSKRIINLVPNYEKPLMGTLAILEIGLDAIRQECPLFRKWIEQLEQWPR